VKPDQIDASALYNRANELAAAGESGAAVLAYQELCAKFPDDARFPIAFGVLLKSLGHWEQSIEKFLAGLALRPHYCEGDARLMLAESYLSAGQKGKAVEQWRIVAQMSPEYPSYDRVPNEAKERLKEHAA
jgi:predicted Zn-dependent protease